eukprot:SAG11_NODE_2294_length_3556_cov_3.734741_6_plen_94_part_01
MALVIGGALSPPAVYRCAGVVLPRPAYRQRRQDFRAWRRALRGRPSAAAFGGATWAPAGHVPLQVPAGCRDPGAHSAWDRRAAGAIRAGALARL